MKVRNELSKGHAKSSAVLFGNVTENKDVLASPFGNFLAREGVIIPQYR